MGSEMCIRDSGVPNDILVRLNVLDATVMDVPIRPIYNQGEQSSMNLFKVIPTISLLLSRLFIFRLKEKYILRNFHPLVLFYFFGILFFAASLILGAIEVQVKIASGAVPVATTVLVTMLFVSGIQFLCFAMLFDMLANQKISIPANFRK